MVFDENMFDEKEIFKNMNKRSSSPMKFDNGIPMNGGVQQKDYFEGTKQ